MLVLQSAFVLAGALTWVAVIVLAVGLWRTRRGRPGRELPAEVAGRAALLFAGPCLVVATARGRSGSATVSDVLLGAAVFGLAAALLRWSSQAAALRSQPAVRRALVVLSCALPVGAGLLAGVVGTP